MRPDAMLVNTSRAGVVDTDALLVVEDIAAFAEGAPIRVL